MEYGNLREHALQRMNDLGLKCRDVRTREIGIQEVHNKVNRSTKYRYHTTLIKVYIVLI